MPVSAFFKRVLLPALLAGLMAACLNDGGTEIPNELVGREFLAGKGPAADAEINLVPTGHQPGKPFGGDTSSAKVFRTRTKADGSFAFRGVPAGTYNVLASDEGSASFRGAVPVSGKRQDLAADTLRPPGSVSGRIVLEPQDDPASAQVQVLGTLLFVNVDSDGRFKLSGLAAGTYRLAVTTVLPGYSPYYKEFTVGAGAVDTLPEPLRPFYSEIPVVTGLTAAPGPDGTVALRWNASAYRNLQAYLVYRDAPDAVLPSAKPFARTSDTVFLDTIYAKKPKAGQYPYLDTARHPFTYRVGILTTTQSLGPTLGSTTALAVPPSVKAVSGRWSLALAKAPFLPAAGYSLAVLRDTLWLAGLRDYGGGFIWCSTDGTNWTLMGDSLAFGKDVPTGDAGYLHMMAFKDRLWISGEVTGPSNPGDAGGVRNSLWSSVDGRTWRSESDSLAISPARSRHAMLVSGGRMWILNGHPWYLGGEIEPVLSSVDGLTWIPASATKVFALPAVAAVDFKSRIWSLGNPLALEIARETDASVFSSSDGAVWNLESRNAPFLPRQLSCMVAHDGKLYVIGGAPPQADPSVDPIVPTAEAWQSADGKNWTLMDAHAPFGPRYSQRAISFKGKLWVFGGITTSGEGARDIWSLE